MTIMPKLKATLICYACFFVYLVSAHEVIVHRAITFNALESTLGNSSGYNNFLSLISVDLPAADATNFVVQGSEKEDDSGKDVGGNRSYNHFYDPLDPTYGKGLSDAPSDLRCLIGDNSFAWASTSNCLGVNFLGVLHIGRNFGTSNTYSWQNARGYEWLGLTVASSADRFVYLTNMFRAVGQVVHLLEDTSQPQHVRNEQHVNPFTNSIATSLDPWASPIENWGMANFTNLNYQHAILDWISAGFIKN